MIHWWWLIPAAIVPVGVVLWLVGRALESAFSGI